MGKDENMSQKSNADEWYRFAMMYAQAASYLMGNRGTPYEAICYLGSLSAECAMKGFLLKQGADTPPETHNLVELCQACARFEDEFTPLLDECNLLGRFTTPSGFPTMEKAALEDALQVMDTARDVLRLTAYSQEQTLGPGMTM